MSRTLTTILGTMALVALFTTTAFAKEITVQGRLQRTVEPGGWVISTGSQEYLLLNFRNFQNETWFGEGREVEAVGETKPDVMTTQMQGTPFEARTMRGLARGNAATQIESRGLSKVAVIGDSIVQAPP